MMGFFKPMMPGYGAYKAAEANDYWKQQARQREFNELNQGAAHIDAIMQDPSVPQLRKAMIQHAVSTGNIDQLNKMFDQMGGRLKAQSEHDYKYYEKPAPTAEQLNFGAGIDPATGRYHSFMSMPESLRMDYRQWRKDRTPKTEVNLPGSEQGRMATAAEVEMLGHPVGTKLWRHPKEGFKLVPKKGGSAFSDAQTKAGGFAHRMYKAEKIMRELEDQGFDPSAVVQHIQDFGVPEGMANITRDESGQKYYQAMIDWMRAKLRRESGAVINMEEIDNEQLTYFMKAWSKPGMRQQLRDARQTAIENEAFASGGAFEDLLNYADEDSSWKKGLTSKAAQKTQVLEAEVTAQYPTWKKIGEDTEYLYYRDPARPGKKQRVKK